MHDQIKKLLLIKQNIINKKSEAKVIAVSKTFPMEKILPLIEHGHLDYGENRVQEAIEKWPEIKSKFENIKLHLIGNLQTNKVKYLFPLFDYIHSLDNIKLAKKIFEEQEKTRFKPKIFIQVNIGGEDQKNGIDESKVKDFYKHCKDSFDLNIIGLMCIPPIENSKNFFSKMQELNSSLGLKELSMGMSADYENALDFGASYIRIGSSIFGNRS